ncbi:polysaccharide biosynthesis protein [Planktomarina temperata]|nr:polysaccharide biosynthesis protein [Planktomarina temperata]
MMDLTDKTFCITGGTGSFGKTMLLSLLRSNAKTIKIFSRDEKKQDALRKAINDERVQFILGDVRDINDLKYAFNNVDFVFHAAALKQVPSCEFFPEQALRTNVQGTHNAALAARDVGVKKFVMLSTDKAVYPINAMGISKALAEKIIQAEARKSRCNDTQFMITRYGNVMGSRGSVIPLFIDQILNHQKLTITNPNMTRFMMNLAESIDLVLHAFTKGKSGNIYVHKAPSCTVWDLSVAVAQIFNVPHEVAAIGTRHGEKLYETLVSDEEMAKAQDQGDYYEIPIDERDLNYNSFVEEGNSEQSLTGSLQFNSHNAHKLFGEELVSFLKKQDFIKDALDR